MHTHWSVGRGEGGGRREGGGEGREGGGGGEGGGEGGGGGGGGGRRTAYHPRLAYFELRFHPSLLPNLQSGGSGSEARPGKGTV